MDADQLVNQHFENILHLLKIERTEDLRQYQLKVANRSIQDKKKEGVCWYPIQLLEQKMSLGDRCQLKLERLGDFEQRHFFQSGVSVSLFSNQAEESNRISGVISYLKENQVKLILNTDSFPDWLSNGKLGLDLLFDESTYNAMEDCIKKLLTVKSGRIQDLKQLFIGENTPRFSKSQDFSIPSLNESQNHALKHAMSSQDVGIIHGPPGTGKTTTLVKSIKAIASDEKQVLVCAPSNVAVDILVEKLVEQRVNVVRLGHPARVTEQVLHNTLDAKLTLLPDYKELKSMRKKTEEYWKLASKYKRNFGPAERAQRKQVYEEAKRLKGEARALENHLLFKIIDEAEVIACTLTGADHKMIKNRQFKTVFIDEAGQAMEPACWIPMLRAERVIMAGDHQQLPPTVKSFEALKAGLGYTLFERIAKEKAVGELLKVQYRMRPEIMSYSSQYFYGGQLETAPEVLSLPSVFEGEEVMFVDTAGCGFDEKINEQTLSTYNSEEAKLLLKDLKRLLTGLNDDMDIGVIAPYKAQVNLLKEILSTLDLDERVMKHIAIHSVDGFQGQEKDIIYMSLVRSNDKGEIGFLKDIRRMNVAMTRAKHKLVIFGDSATLSTLPFYDQLISFCQERNWYKSAFEIIYSE